jgi:hypothetical protein
MDSCVFCARVNTIIFCFLWREGQRRSRKSSIVFISTAEIVWDPIVINCTRMVVVVLRVCMVMADEGKQWDILLPCQFQMTEWVLSATIQPPLSGSLTRLKCKFSLCFKHQTTNAHTGVEVYYKNGHMCVHSHSSWERTTLSAPKLSASCWHCRRL